MQTKCNFVLFHENRQNIHLCDNIQVKGKTSYIHRLEDNIQMAILSILIYKLNSFQNLKPF